MTRWTVNAVLPLQPEKEERFEDKKAVAVVLFGVLHLPYMDRAQGKWLADAVLTARRDQKTDCITIDGEKIDVAPDGDGARITYARKNLIMDATDSENFAKRVASISNSLR